MKQKVNVVWLKRDLRTRDHRPLVEAEKADIPYILLYLYEPSMLAYPDSDLRHLQFIYGSLLDMNRRLKDYAGEVSICYGEVSEVYSSLATEYEIKHIYSYQESGTRHTWIRDKRLYKWCKENGVKWLEYPRDGILRGINNRKGWDKEWFITMNDQVYANTFTRRKILVWNSKKYKLPEEIYDKLVQYPSQYQPPGETNAWKYLRTFAESRGRQYHKLISKPNESRMSCSRISPYLAWGNLSIRQAYQYINHHPNKKKNKRPYNAFLTRLKWHCHFIQKFEMECTYETRCINRGYELLSYQNSDELLEAWKNGKTGFPLIDACMRCVTKTGWINFRMRAMLVSFLCHHLDQDWRRGVYHLARKFLDYEPGIHYPQFQMQAGTTGVNTIRMYNPVKQSIDHDPEGLFIKKWVAELATLPIEYVHMPWKMTIMEQQLYGVILGEDYPFRIIDLKESGKKARDKIWGHRNNPLVKKESKRILQVHTRRTK